MTCNQAPGLSEVLHHYAGVWSMGSAQRGFAGDGVIQNRHDDGADHGIKAACLPRQIIKADLTAARFRRG